MCKHKLYLIFILLLVSIKFNLKYYMRIIQNKIQEKIYLRNLHTDKNYFNK